MVDLSDVSHRNPFYLLQGDKGYCYIPYDYITNENYCFDVWTVRKVATNDFGQEYWDQDDSVDYQQPSDEVSGDENDRAIEELDNDDDDDDDSKGNINVSLE